MSHPPAPAPHDRPLLLTNGAVRVTPDAALTDAILLAEGRVAALGSPARAAAADTGARVVDLDGATVAPGLIDTHPHLLHFAAEADGVLSLADAADHAEILRRIGAAARSARPGEWVFTTPVGEPFYGVAASSRSLPERQLPDRAALDGVAREVPVMIQAYAPADPGVAVFNTAALTALGITEALPSDLGTVFAERGWDGTLTGRFYGEVQELYVDNPFWAELLTRIPRPSPELQNTTAAAIRAAHRRGITAIYEPHETTLAELAVFRALRQAGVRLRVAASPEYLDGASPDGIAALPAFVAAVADAARANDDWIRVLGPALSLHSAFSIPPRRLPSGGFAQGTPGTLPELLRTFTASVVAAGLRGSLLSASPSQHDLLVDVLQHTPGFASTPDAPWIVQHLPVVTPAQIQAFQGLGLAGTTSPGFARGLPEAMLGLSTSLGAERQDLLPLGRFVDAGFPVAAGSDWGPASPFAQMGLALAHAAAHHRDGAAPFSRADALAMWTTLGSRVLGWRELGRLTPGSSADLIVLPDDPLRIDPARLDTIAPLATLVGGAPVFDGGEVFS